MTDRHKAPAAAALHSYLTEASVYVWVTSAAADCYVWALSQAPIPFKWAEPSCRVHNPPTGPAPIYQHSLPGPLPAFSPLLFDQTVFYNICTNLIWTKHFYKVKT